MSESVAHRCEGSKRYGLACQRTTLHPSRTCADHRRQAGHGLPLIGYDEDGEWRCYTMPTPTGWCVRIFRVINGGDYGYFARRRYVKSLEKALEVRDAWAAALRGPEWGAALGWLD